MPRGERAATAAWARLTSAVARHASRDSCWVVIHNVVYDVTAFLDEHPGGAGVILRYAGRDATAEYDPIHPPGTLEENLAQDQILGPLDPSTVRPPPPQAADAHASSRPAAERAPPAALPPLAAQLSLRDFEVSAQKVLAPKAWAYYSSGSDDQLSQALNTAAYRAILLRPRILRDVEAVDTRASLLGGAAPLALPLFVAPAAMARLAHHDGEAAIAQACGRHGVLQCVSNNASLRPEQIAQARVADAQPLWFQLYVQRDRAKTEALLARIAAPGSGYTAIVVTLDAPTPGKREADERVKNLEALESGASGEALAAGGGGGGLGKALFAGTTPKLTWEDLPWIRAHAGALPLVLKGIQTHEDALLACRPAALALGVRGIILSNHGGRAADTAPPAVYTLAEIRRFAPEVLRRLEVYVDGGVRRGTDVVKALCLGARAVGIGRPALYGLAGYGAPGVERVLAILRDEIETAMRLLGVTSVRELGPACVNTAALEGCLYRPEPDDGGDEGAWRKAKL